MDDVRIIYVYFINHVNSASILHFHVSKIKLGLSHREPCDMGFSLNLISVTQAVQKQNPQGYENNKTPKANTVRKKSQSNQWEKPRWFEIPQSWR